jgi:hypothetical protein
MLNSVMKKFDPDYIIGIVLRLSLCLVLVLVITGCAPIKNKTVNAKIDPIANADALGKVLGCVFAPAECDKYKKEQDQKQQQDSITKEFDSVDRDNIK